MCSSTRTGSRASELERDARVLVAQLVADELGELAHDRVRSLPAAVGPELVPDHAVEHQAGVAVGDRVVTVRCASDPDAKLRRAPPAWMDGSWLVSPASTSLPSASPTRLS